MPDWRVPRAILFRRLVHSVSVCTTIAAWIVLTGINSQAQQKPLHLNPVIAKLAEGKTVYGLITGDLSVANARDTARAPVDFVYADEEHNPVDLAGLHIFLLGMSDRGMVHEKGTLQPNVALFARFPQEADQSQWVVQQALDMGLMGFIFNGVASKEQALAAIQSMRYPQMKNSEYPQPIGIRGNGAANAIWVWGVGADEYQRRADVWPLNPGGDLLAIIMIESVEGLKHLDEIASVPGVGALFVGAGGDLHLSMGVPTGAPEVEAGFQQVLRTCKARNIPCAITANSADDVAKRVREGWRIIRSTVPAITGGRALLGETQENRSRPVAQ
jgi:4-hydroxy-2-oxoheptanedioate aldolase